MPVCSMRISVPQETARSFTLTRSTRCKRTVHQRHGRGGAEVRAAIEGQPVLAVEREGYLFFAQAETGWFLTAFASGAFDVQMPADPTRTVEKGLNPLELLSYALAEVVKAGVLPPERRPGVEFLAWSTVHGMALLIIDGPLRHPPVAMRQALGARLLHMVETGI